MKKHIKLVIKIIISAIISIFLLSIFCLIFNYTGCHINNPDGSTDYKWIPNQVRSNMIEGFAWLKFDENGFNNSSDYFDKKSNVDILLMGSSHMEAAQIKANENVASLLNEKLPNKYIYNIGVSGHTIYTCVKNLNSASKNYSPKEYIILETDSINLDINKMSQVINADYQKIASHDSGLLYFVQKNIPAVKTIFKSLSDWLSVSNNEIKRPYIIKNIDAISNEESQEIDVYKAALDDFLAYAQSSIRGNEKLIIFYHPQTNIDAKGKFIVLDRKQEKVEIFNELCEKHNIVFLDLTNDFKKIYETESILTHGFKNTAIGVGHLNKYGHKLIAESILNVISESEVQHDVK